MPLPLKLEGRCLLRSRTCVSPSPVGRAASSLSRLFLHILCMCRGCRSARSHRGSHCPALLSLDIAALVALERTEPPRVSAGRCGVNRIQDHVLVSVSALPNRVVRVGGNVWLGRKKCQCFQVKHPKGSLHCLEKLILYKGAA